LLMFQAWREETMRPSAPPTRLPNEFELTGV